MDVWDGLDECEISRPEILSQSAFALAIVLNCNTCFGMLNNGQVCFSRSLILILAFIYTAVNLLSLLTKSTFMSALFKKTLSVSTAVSLAPVICSHLRPSVYINSV